MVITGSGDGDRDSGLIVTQSKPSSRTDGYVARLPGEPTTLIEAFATNYSPGLTARLNSPVSSSANAASSLWKPIGRRSPFLSPGNRL
jgi:hypothetical protein